jgi:trimethylamine--corrinoid protein Co-methyltransferase
MVYSHIKYSDKAFMGSVTHPDRAEDTVEHGQDRVRRQTSSKRIACMVNLINANSPMTFDATMLGALKVYARTIRPRWSAPFILAGAMSPVTVAGTAAQSLAEALCGMALRAAVRNPARR